MALLQTFKNQGIPLRVSRYSNALGIEVKDSAMLWWPSNIIKFRGFMFHWFTVFFVVSLQMFASSFVEAYEKPIYLDEALWAEVQPYLLPEDHPIKSKLDKFFAKDRWIESMASLEKSDFVCMKHKAWDNIIVAKHKKLPGYVVKLYTDDQCGVDARGLLLQRVRGALHIQSIIDAHEGYADMFKVPRKWLFPVPNAEWTAVYDRKQFILITEDMNIVGAEKKLSTLEKFENKQRPFRWAVHNFAGRGPSG